LCHLYLCSVIPRPLSSTLFPYTTLFRSKIVLIQGFTGGSFFIEGGRGKATFLLFFGKLPKALGRKLIKETGLTQMVQSHIAQRDILFQNGAVSTPFAQSMS